MCLQSIGHYCNIVSSRRLCARRLVTSRCHLVALSPSQSAACWRRSSPRLPHELGPRDRAPQLVVLLSSLLSKPCARRLWRYARGKRWPCSPGGMLNVSRCMTLPACIPYQGAHVRRLLLRPCSSRTGRPALSVNLPLLRCYQQLSSLQRMFSLARWPVPCVVLIRLSGRHSLALSCSQEYLSPKSFTPSRACCESSNRAAPAGARSSPCSCSLKPSVSGVMRERKGGQVGLRTRSRSAVACFYLLVCRTTKRLREDSYPNKGCRERTIDHSRKTQTCSSCHLCVVRCCR